MSSRVRVEVLEAKNLCAADSGGTSDPLCIVQVVGSKDSKHKVKTKTIQKTLTPVWNETFTFDGVDVYNKETNTLRFEVYDKDTFSDDFLGRCDIALETLKDSKLYHVWLKLKDSKSGEIRVRITVERMRDHKSSHQKLADSIIQYCKANNSVWEDTEFPANDKALYKTGSGPIKNVEWKRPSQICNQPKLFVDGVEAGDVIQVTGQGTLGDCYFLGALSVVATRKDLLEPLFVSAHPECGFYQCKFWKNGDWHVVTVDDRIPVIGKTPIYSRCKDPNEMWVPIIEKAYAKLHGCYEALESGSIAAALADLTGEGTQTLPFEDQAIRKQIQTGELWKELLFFDSEQFLMGCSFNGEGEVEEDNGMGILKRKNHAYGIMKCVESKQGIKLLQIRNPWGHLEWRGRYSDGSGEWTEDLKEELKVTFGDDGNFWMCFEDFLQQYNQFIVLRLLTDDVGKKWEKAAFVGEWKESTDGGKRESNAGGSTNNPTWRRNPQYGIIVNQQTRLFIHLAQPDQRLLWNKEYPIPIGMHLVKSKDCRLPKTSLANDEIVHKIAYTPSRDVALSCTLAPGEYIVAPSTFYPSQETKYWINFYSEEPVRVSEVVPYKETFVKGEWRGPSAGGCFNHQTWVKNPKYLISVSADYADPVPVVIALRQPDRPKLNYIGMYSGKWVNQPMDRNIYKGSKPCLNAREVTIEYTLGKEDWPIYVIPHVFDAGVESQFELYVLSNISVKIDVLNV